MQKYVFSEFGLDNLELVDVESVPPGPGEVAIRVEALSLNYRDLLVIKGAYNPRLELPQTPVSDGAGEIVAVGDGVSRVAVGDRVMSHFVAGWLDGPFRGEYIGTTLGTPGPGLARSEVVLPAAAVVKIPNGYKATEAACLPIAALTAWSALVTEGRLEAGQTVLTLGTGGVSIFALTIAKALGAKVIITSSSDEKLARAAALGADHTINYVSNAAWGKEVLSLTDRKGADIVVENGGIGTLGQSLKAVKAGGTVAMLGALTGLGGEVNIAAIPMKRIRVAGILVDSRSAFEQMVQFLEQHQLKPVIDATFRFDQLAEALRHMESGQHFGKIVVEL